MRKLFAAVTAALIALATAAQAENDKPGAFDYYVLSLSWSPNWCATEGDARGADQCDPRHDFGWTLHGLWPQFHRGWPAYCRTPHAPPSRGMTADMADIMGSSGLAWHQWKKHGTCSGLNPSQYFGLSRRAYGLVKRPDILRRLDKPVQLPATLIEDAFLQQNPDWTADMLTVTCKAGHIAEARLCLSRDLQPVPCGRDVIQDCTIKDALFQPVR